MTTATRTATALAALALLAACGSSPSQTSAESGDETAVVLFPGTGAAEQLQSGCWATFYGERSFGGDSLTLIGPADLRTLDRGTAQQLRRDIRSVATGPRATLVLYEKQFLSARSVAFEPGSRESGLVEKLGFGGRVESMQLRCSN